jgi:hypothetical protein
MINSATSNIYRPARRRGHDPSNITKGTNGFMPMFLGDQELFRSRPANLSEVGPAETTFGSAAKVDHAGKRNTHNLQQKLNATQSILFHEAPTVDWG